MKFVSDNPSLAEVNFRIYQGKEDLHKMLPLMVASVEADSRQYSGATVEGLIRQYDHMSNCDPFHDSLLAEVEGKLVAYSRCHWMHELGKESLYIYLATIYVAPEWREQGLGEAIFEWTERRLREISVKHSDEHSKFFEAYAYDNESYWACLYNQFNYAPVRYFQQMQRSNLDNIPDFPLADGLALRPAIEDHYRTIWDSNHEAFKDSWGFVPPTEASYQNWLSDKEIFQPELWQVAWDINTEEIAGQVRSFVDQEWNDRYECKRGFIDEVSVRGQWRRQGVGRALLTRSLRRLKAEGMTSAELNVDSESPTGATRLYKDCGFEILKRSKLYRKRL